MRVEMKYRDGVKWKLLPLEDLRGKSRIQFMLNTDKQIIAALIEENNKPVLFVGNDETELVKYKDKAQCLTVQDMMLLFQSEMVPLLIANIWPEATLGAVELEQPVSKEKLKEVTRHWYQ